jgi:hypothetical protein
MIKVIPAPPGLRQDPGRPAINTNMDAPLVARVQRIVAGQEFINWDTILIVEGKQIVDTHEIPRLHGFTTLGSLPGQSSSFRFWCNSIVKGFLVVS